MNIPKIVPSDHAFITRTVKFCKCKMHKETMSEKTNSSFKIHRTVYSSCRSNNPNLEIHV